MYKSGLLISFITLLAILAGCAKRESTETSGKPQKLPEISLHLRDPQFQEFLKEHRHIHMLLDSFDYFTKQKKTNRTAHIKVRIANYLRQTGNYSEGIRFLHEVLNQNNLSKTISVQAFYGLSSIYYELYFHSNKQKNYLDSSAMYAVKSLKNIQREDDNLKTDLLNIMGGINIQNGAYSQAIIYLDSALKITKQGNKQPGPELFNNLAFAYNKTGDYEKALLFATKCLQLAKKQNNEVFESISLQTQAEIYQNMGDSLLAQQMLIKSGQLKSNKNAILKTLIAKELILNYHHNKDSETIADLNEEHYYLLRLSVLLVITAFILVVAFLLLLYFLRQGRRLRKSEKELHQSRIQAEQLKHKNIQLELKAREAESKALKSQIERKEAELAAKLTALSQANGFLLSIQQEINTIKHHKHSLSIATFLANLDNKINHQLNENIWEEFERLYSSGNSSFIKKLNSKYPELSTNDKRLSYLILMNLSTKEIANVLSKSHRSVEVARHRLRNKLSLDRTDNLHKFLQDINNAD